jgi:hypothetical protein
VTAAGDDAARRGRGQARPGQGGPEAPEAGPRLLSCRERTDVCLAGWSACLRRCCSCRDTGSPMQPPPWTHLLCCRQQHLGERVQRGHRRRRLPGNERKVLHQYAIEELIGGGEQAMGRGRWIGWGKPGTGLGKAYEHVRWRGQGRGRRPGCYRGSREKGKEGQRGGRAKDQKGPEKCRAASDKRDRAASSAGGYPPSVGACM